MLKCRSCRADGSDDSCSQSEHRISCSGSWQQECLDCWRLLLVSTLCSGRKGAATRPKHKTNHLYFPTQNFDVVPITLWTAVGHLLPQNSTSGLHCDLLRWLSRRVARPDRDTVDRIPSGDGSGWWRVNDACANDRLGCGIVAGKVCR